MRGWVPRCARSACRRSSWSMGSGMRSWPTPGWCRSTSPAGPPMRCPGGAPVPNTPPPRTLRGTPAIADMTVAVGGSGPSGLNAAVALVKQAAKLDPPVTVQVDVIDRLPTPYGLVRYGVAPDHPSIKSIAEVLRRVLEHPQVRFLGGVHLRSEERRCRERV